MIYLCVNEIIIKKLSPFSLQTIFNSFQKHVFYVTFSILLNVNHISDVFCQFISVTRRYTCFMSKLSRKHIRYAAINCKIKGGCAINQRAREL